MRQDIRQLNQIPISVQINGFAADFLWWGVYDDNWWRNYLHVHTFYEICYVFQGRGVFRINHRDYVVEPGQLFIAKPGELHEIISDETHPLGIYFWSYTLIAPAKRHNDDTQRLFQSFIDSNICVSNHTGMTASILDLLLDEVQRREAGYVEAIQGLVTKLLLETTRSITDIPPQQIEDSAQDTIVKEAVQYLKDNYARDVSVRDVAAQVHLSERQTARRFREATGFSIKAYLIDLRLKIASQLLLKQNMTVSQVANAVGYTDVRYFTTLFRRQKGLTPSAFQQQRGTQFV